MHTNKLKNDTVKLNLAFKNIDTDLQIGMQTLHRSCAITRIEGTCWSPQSEVKHLQ